MYLYLGVDVPTQLRVLRPLRALSLLVVATCTSGDASRSIDWHSNWNLATTASLQLATQAARSRANEPSDGLCPAQHRLAFGCVTEQWGQFGRTRLCPPGH